MEWIDANTFFGTWHRRRMDVPPEELVRLLREAGTSRALTLSLSGPLLEAEEGNDATRLATLRHRELIPMGTIDPRVYVGGRRRGGLRNSGAPRCGSPTASTAGRSTPRPWRLSCGSAPRRT